MLDYVIFGEISKIIEVKDIREIKGKVYEKYVWKYKKHSHTPERKSEEGEGKMQRSGS